MKRFAIFAAALCMLAASADAGCRAFRRSVFVQPRVVVSPFGFNRGFGFGRRSVFVGGGFGRSFVGVNAISPVGFGGFVRRPVFVRQPVAFQRFGGVGLGAFQQRELLRQQAVLGRRSFRSFDPVTGRFVEFERNGSIEF